MPGIPPRVTPMTLAINSAANWSAAPCGIIAGAQLPVARPLLCTSLDCLCEAVHDLHTVICDRRRRNLVSARGNDDVNPMFLTLCETRARRDVPRADVRVC